MKKQLIIVTSLLLFTCTTFWKDRLLCVEKVKEQLITLKEVGEYKSYIAGELEPEDAKDIAKIKTRIEYYLQNGTIGINKLRPLIRGFIKKKKNIRQELPLDHAPEELMPIKDLTDAIVVPLTIQLILESDLLSVKDKKTLVTALLKDRKVTGVYRDQLKMIEKNFLNKLSKNAYFKGISNPILEDKKVNSMLHFLMQTREQKKSNTARVIISALTKPIDWNVQNSDGETPLHIATGKKNRALIEFLISKGADLTTSRNDGKTPLLKLLNSNLNLGVQHEKLPKLEDWIKGEQRRLLKELKTNQETQKLINIIENDGILHENDLKLIKILSGIEKNDTNLTKQILDIPSKNNGWTPLHYAAAYHAPSIVSFFIQHEADTKTKDHSDRTPLHVAAQRGRTFNAKVLIQKGHANPEEQNNKLFRPVDVIENKIGQIISSGHDKAMQYYGSTLESLLLIEKVMQGKFEWGNYDPNKWWKVPWIDPWVLSIDFSEHEEEKPSDGELGDEFDDGDRIIFDYKGNPIII